jgi:hypothetical protein
MRFWKSTGVLASLMLLMTFASAGAFDGHRKGFVLGFGVGTGVTMFTQEMSVNYTWNDTTSRWEPMVRADKSDQQTKLTIATDFKIGYGLTDQLLVYYVMQVSWFQHNDVFAFDSTETDRKEDLWAPQGFDAEQLDGAPAAKSIYIASGVAGLGISYYLRPTTPSFYVTGAAGFSTWTAPFETDDWLLPYKDHARTWFDVGFFGGAGYEFSKNWRVEATGTWWGSPGETTNIDSDGTPDMDVSSSGFSMQVILVGMIY